MATRALAAEQSVLEESLSRWMKARRERLIETISDLVRIPSENTPPVGAEGECQRYVHDRLAGYELETEMYELTEVPGFTEHPVYRPGRDYGNRPNVSAVWRGSGGGRSLLLSGHIDTVPRGSAEWSRDPFMPTVEGNRLYGLGSNDMKGGIGAFLFAVEALKEAGVKLRGDLLLETIVDEEFGGVNGTLAARLHGRNADAAIICEPSQMMICPAQTGGRTAHITLRAQTAGILSEGEPQARVTDQLHHFLGRVGAFAERRRKVAPIHALYSDSNDPVPAWVTKINCGGWGMKEPITLPTTCQVEFYWQAMPGETREAIESEFFAWLEEVVAEQPALFACKPEVSFPIRWLPGSALEGEPALITELSGTFEGLTGAPPQIRGIGGPCDLYVFHQHFETPAILFGPRGGNTHAPDEWVEIDSALLTAETLARFICRWCEVEW
ncbi:MAG: M20/M25/M40 family metallo-hydrolase [Blastocatellia bacterium]|nr:M20/M25/M40 family metallo-hydrolase [Blastocatellia bacterium]